MKVPLVAGNWKMNLNATQAVALASAVAERAPALAGVEVAICAPFVYLESVRRAIGSRPVALGAQDVFYEPKGAFTGEISAAMLIDLGCHYVIVGHSERRHILGETDEVANRKVRAALAAGLTPILCVGELLAEREANRTSEVIHRQIEESLADLDVGEIGRLVIAYEPVWAIGTGKVATPEQAQEVHTDLRKILRSRYNSAVVRDLRILYGGSVQPGNADALLKQADIDGVLVGGASLMADEFVAIAAAAIA